ncbi:MAG: hypothetical protein DLM58_13710, partial [Pseudonocardiales bacterium]
MENPLLGANRKAKPIKSLLETKWRRVRLRTLRRSLCTPRRARRPVRHCLGPPGWPTATTGAVERDGRRRRPSGTFLARARWCGVPAGGRRFPGARRVLP